MNRKNFSVLITSALEADPALKQQYGRERYRCFDPNDPYVNLDPFRQVEFDDFDRRSDTLYFMVTVTEAGQQRLVSAVRVRPTTVDYELEMPSYHYLTHNMALPKSPCVMEGSRWVGRSSRTVEGKISTGLLMLALHRYCRNQGVTSLIGTISTKSQGWLSRRRAVVERDSDLFYSERDALTIMVSTIPVDEQFRATAHTMLLDGMEECDLMNLGLASAA